MIHMKFIEDNQAVRRLKFTSFPMSQITAYIKLLAYKRKKFYNCNSTKLWENV